MHKTVIKSNRPASGTRQLIRGNTSAGHFEDPIDEMDVIIPDKGYTAKLWLNVKEQMKANIEIEKKKSFMEGKSASIEEAKNDVADEVRTIQALIASLAEDTINSLGSFEQSLVKLSIKIAEKVIKKKVEEEQDLVLSVVKSALSTIKESAEITVLLNSNDFELLNNYDEIKSYNGSRIKFAVDDEVKSGGCKILSDWGVIDAQIETQLEEIYTQLVKQTEDQSTADS